MSAKKCLIWISVVLTAPLVGAEENPIQRAAAAGTIKIVRHTPPAPDGPPDLVTFTSGRIVEAWGLSVVGSEVEYQVRGSGGAWKRERRPKSQVLSIEMGRTLEDLRREEQAREESTREQRIVAAEKQPVRQEDVLSGGFVAAQGKHTQWTFDFTSELNKFYTFAEDATEYGLFKIRSHTVKPGPKGKSYETEVIARGKYFLYAPGIYSNQDWVLNLTRVTYMENDISPRSSFYTDRLGDEVFILKLSRDRKVFHLEWANQGGWQWTSPVQQTFYRKRDSRERNRPREVGGSKATGVSLLPRSLSR